MTTTSYNVGIAGDEKPTSRVLRPPGGASSNIFGTTDDEDRQRALQRKPISNVFSADSNANDCQSAQKAKAQQSQSNIFGDPQESQSTSQQRKQQQGEEFPAYDVSVYAAQMTPQKRNVNRASNHNPITGAVNPGCEDSPLEQMMKGKRHVQVSVTSPDTVSTHNPITGEANPGCYDYPVEYQKGRKHVSNGTQDTVSSHNPITGEANPGFENYDDEPLPAGYSKGRRNIGAFNPITGEPIGNQAGEGDNPNKSKPSSRVLNPPGGKSTALW